MTHSDAKRIGGGKCPPSCQLGLKQFLSLFSACDTSTTCTGAERECDGDVCLCKSGFKEDPSIGDPGPTDDCIFGRKSLPTDKANPQVSKDLEKCQKSHISS